MFGGWQSFYQMTGEAAATLTGLLFLVVSLMSGRQVPSTSVGVKLFTTPTVFHLVSVLVVSALALAPDGRGESQNAIMIGWSLIGLVYAGVIAVRLSALPNPSHWSDFWWYGVGPALTYVALAGATATAWVRAPHAAYLVALCLMSLLILAIRNAWDLVTWIAPRRDGS
jgi:hypothetical protein